MDYVTNQIIHLKQEADELSNRKLELKKERAKKEKKITEIESKLKSKDQQVSYGRRFFRYMINKIKSLSDNISKNQTPFLVGRSKERIGIICQKDRRRVWIKS